MEIGYHGDRGESGGRRAITVEYAKTTWEMETCALATMSETGEELTPSGTGDLHIVLMGHCPLAAQRIFGFL